jgi:hypothetical protein
MLFSNAWLDLGRETRTIAFLACFMLGVGMCLFEFFAPSESEAL